MGQNVVIKNAFAIRKGERKLTDETEFVDGSEEQNNTGSGSIVLCMTVIC